MTICFHASIFWTATTYGSSNPNTASPTIIFAASNTCCGAAIFRHPATSQAQLESCSKARISLLTRPIEWHYCPQPRSHDTAFFVCDYIIPHAILIYVSNLDRFLDLFSFTSVCCPQWLSHASYPSSHFCHSRYTQMLPLLVYQHLPNGPIPFSSKSHSHGRTTHQMEEHRAR